MSVIDLSISDPTQTQILSHLSITELLIKETVTRLSGSEQVCDIYALPDLGLPHNVTRIRGGFYTGALYSWQCEVPFVPIDATVNSCGVSIYKIKTPLQLQRDFEERLKSAQAELQQKGPYVWNFSTGNHFVVYGKSRNTGEYFLVLHSSAAEDKGHRNGLYPVEANWYWDDVRIVNSGSRYLRYLAGKTAEMFIQKAYILESYNRTRHEHIAHLILKNDSLSVELSTVPHYGMPTDSSVAIGCQWSTDRCVLLTRPGCPLFIVKPSSGQKNTVYLSEAQLCLNPHGLGVQSVNGLSIDYSSDFVYINGNPYGHGESLADKEGFCIRSFSDSSDDSNTVDRFFAQCPGEVLKTIEPIFTYSRHGFSSHLKDT